MAAKVESCATVDRLLHSVHEMFQSQPVDEGQGNCISAVRQAGEVMATTILLNCPPSADRSDAIRKVREAVFTAVASIALKGMV